MAVAAALVVGHQHLRALLSNQRDQPPDDLVEVGAGEALRVVVLGRADHPGVAVAELDEAADSERAHGLGQLALAHLAQVLGRGQARVGDLAGLAPSAGDEHGPRALGGVPASVPPVASASSSGWA